VINLLSKNSAATNAGTRSKTSAEYFRLKQNPTMLQIQQQLGSIVAAT
jgi:hypothetical protein